MSRKKIWGVMLSLVVAVTVMFAFGGNVFAATVEDEGDFGSGLHWSLDSDGKLTISKTVAGNVTMPDYLPYEKPAWANYYSSIKSIVIEDGITNIGNYAFYFCAQATSVSLPDSITSIGENAFEQCGALQLNAIPKNTKTIGNYAFYQCTSLTSVNLGDNLETLGAGAFYECSNLTSVTFPSTVKSIGGSAFQESGITSLSLSSGIEYIGSRAFGNCDDLIEAALTITAEDAELESSIFAGCDNLKTVALSGNISSISYGMFEVCPALESVTIPNTITSIGEYAFSGCSSLESISIPSGVTNIGRSAFSSSGLKSATILANCTYGSSYENGVYTNCDSLSSVTISNGVTAIPDAIFSNCDNLKTVTIPNTVTSIGQYAFYYSGLESVVIPSSVKTINKKAFQNCKQLATVTLNEGLESIGDYGFEWCDKITSLSIPSTTTSFGQRTFACTSITSISLTINEGSNPAPDLFSGCNQLETIVISGTMTEVYPTMFYGCGSLTNLTIPDSVTEIGYSAFFGCRKLSNFTIPANVTTIGSQAFYGCKDLTSLTIPNKVESIGDQAFEYSGLTSIVIPNNVTSLGQYMFNGCNNLESITIPTNITSIPEYFFAGCTGLKSYTVPSNITTISGYAFYECGLTSISIPGTVNTIKENAFNQCSSLNTLVILDGVETIESMAFSQCYALETLIISPKVTSVASDSFRYSNYIKTVYCSEAHKEIIQSYITQYNTNVRFIIINDLSNLNTPYIVGHSLTLSADIGVNFFIRFPEGYDINNTVVSLSWGTGDYEHNITGTLVPVNEHGANYKVTCGVAARAMGDIITMVIKSGNIEILHDEYSVVEYANTIARSDDYNAKNLVLAMIEYGNEAQIYFKYETDSLVFDQFNYNPNYFSNTPKYFVEDLDLTEALDPEKQTIRTIVNGDGYGIEYYGASIQCTSQMKMRFYFRVTDETKFNNLTVSFRSQDLEFRSAKVNNEDMVYIETPGLLPGDLEGVFVIKFNDVVYTYDFRDYMQRVGNVDSRFTPVACYAYAFSHYARIYQEGLNG